MTDQLLHTFVKLVAYILFVQLVTLYVLFRILLYVERAGKNK